MGGKGNLLIEELGTGVTQIGHDSHRAISSSRVGHIRRGTLLDLGEFSSSFDPLMKSKNANLSQI